MTEALARVPEARAVAGGLCRADSVIPALFSTIGGVSGVPLNVPEVLPNLNTGAINVINAPCLAAEQLQWAGKLDNLNDAASATAYSAHEPQFETPVAKAMRFPSRLLA